MAKFVYTGDEKQVYPQYIDIAPGRTLVAEPGETYEMTPVDGQQLPVPPDGRWTKPTTKTEKKES